MLSPVNPVLFVMALTICLCSLSTSQSTTDEPFSCYHGSIQSNARGEIPHHSEQNLKPLPCEEQLSLTTTQPISTDVVDSGNDSTSAEPTEVPVTTLPRQQQNISLVNWCTAARYPSSGSVSTKGTWTANFSCLLAAPECPKNMFCCKTPNCNDLKFFQQRTNTKIATVDTCHVMGSHNYTGPVPVLLCPSGSEYCFNRTTTNATNGEKMEFGCSTERTQISCWNITVDNKSRCVRAGSSVLCCCASDNCNGLPSNTSSVVPTNTSSVVPTVPYTTHHLVTASKHSSSWTLVLIIACAVLVGGLVGAATTVVYKRWKKKQNANAPLNISYSRVSADFVDDDNVFSY